MPANMNHDGLHDLEVPRPHGVHDQQSHARPGEHGFGHHRAGEERPGDDGKNGQRRDRGIAQAMLPDHLPLRYPLDARQLHELAVEHLEHGRADQPHDDGDLEPAERDGGQYEVLEPAAARSRQPAEHHGEDPHQHDPQPEAGQRLAEERDDLGGGVHAAAFRDRRQHPYGQGENGADEQRETGELQRGGQALRNQGHGGLALVLEGLAEIALEGLLDEDDVLRGDRLVEAPVLLEALVVLARRFDRQHDVERVAAEAREAEHDQAHDPEGQETLKYPHRYEALHAAFSSTGPS